MTFRVVSDDLRSTGRQPTKHAEEIAALVEGKTIFVPGLTQDTAAGFYSTIRRRNLKLRTQKYTDPKTKEEGVLMWAEPLPVDEPAATPPEAPKTG